MIRISCATLNRIQYEDGRFLLVLNKNRLQNGKRVLTPIGGGLQYRDQNILHSLGAVFEEENSKDLRFYVDEAKVPKFETWFLTRKGRETDPFRELYEELVLEERLLEGLARQDIGIQYIGLVTEQDRSARDIAAEALTKFYFEVFNVRLRQPSWKEIMEGTERLSSRVKLASKSEIQAGRMIDGTEIGSNCLALFKV